MVYLKVQKYTDFEIKCNMKLILRRRRFEQMCISFMANTMWNVPHTDLTDISVFYCEYVKCSYLLVRSKQFIQYGSFIH